MMATTPIYNFNAGPATLPKSVLEEASQACINYKGAGLSVLEIPHRGTLFLNVLEECKHLVLMLCGLSEKEYDVLWLQGGGRAQFLMTAMNFMQAGKAAAYIDSGHWSAEAIKAAGYYGKAEIVASTKEHNYKILPEIPLLDAAQYAYLHITTNNTIFGTQFPAVPAQEVPLIADMSSDIFSLKRNYADFDLVYAVAQKNLGIAGASMVLVKKAFLEKADKSLPDMLSYPAYARNNSMINTPPVFAIYCSLLMLKWISGKGIVNLERENRHKAALLYQEIERNTLFEAIADKESRSLMNVVFKCTQEGKEAAFITQCKQRGIVGIEGHRSVGAFRASLYNAMPLEGIEALVSEMQKAEASFT